MCTSKKKETGIMIINHYNCFIVFHYYQFTDLDLKTYEAYGTCRSINTNIQVNEAYGTCNNTNTTIQDTNIPLYEDMTSIPLQSVVC